MRMRLEELLTELSDAGRRREEKGLEA